MLEYTQGSNTGGYFYPRVRLPPRGYYYATGVRLPTGTPTLPGYDYPPYTGGYSYPARAGLPPGTSTLPGYDYPPYTGGYSYPARAGLPPGTSTLPGYDYPPIHRGVLLPCQGSITPRYFHPARVRLPPIHRGVLLPCQGVNTPPYPGGYSYPARAGLSPGLLSFHPLVFRSFTRTYAVSYTHLTLPTNREV